MSNTAFLVQGRAVLLDMDGTLVDSTAVVEELWIEFAHEFSLSPDEVVRFSHGRPSAATYKHFVPHLSAEERKRLEVARTKKEMIQLDGVVEIPGARAFIEQLRALQVPHALVTSAPLELARVRMAAAQVAVPDMVIPADQITKGKPDPQGYLKAAAALNVAPEDTVVFEDATAGIAAGEAAGAQVVIVGNTLPDEEAAHLHIADYRNLEVRRSGDGTVSIEAA